MPKLHELGKKERTEICRTIARAAHSCLSSTVDSNGCVQGGTFDARMFKTCSELGVIEDDEFYGNSFSPERIEALKWFEKTYQDALGIAAQYDELIVPLANLANDFAMPSAALVRIWCVSRYVAALLQPQNPFADLRVTLCVAEDDDDDEGAEDVEEEVRSNDSEDEEDDDSIIASSSDEDEASSSASASGNGEDDEEEEEKEELFEEACDEQGDTDAAKSPRRKKSRLSKDDDVDTEPEASESEERGDD
ncbi:MAG: hypothetical protein CMI29_08500 [Opitutae bacterium]|nr:hypothetical protein [Opitutae bacterium]|tara:strand:- start:4846 stop:5595 length:750 start_codon:yes stop_codon:yes gene_type:complete